MTTDWVNSVNDYLKEKPSHSPVSEKHPFGIGDIIENDDMGIHNAIIIAATKTGMKVRFLNGHIVHYGNDALKANFKLKKRHTGKLK